MRRRLLIGSTIAVLAGVSAVPALAFRPRAGDWDGNLHGQPISWQMARRAGHVVVEDLVQGAPTCRTATGATASGLNTFATFARVNGVVFGFPPPSRRSSACTRQPGAASGTATGAAAPGTG